MLLKDPKLYDEAHQTIADIDKLVANLNAGKGTAGALLSNDDLHKQLDTLLGKLNTVVDKINAGQGTIGQLTVNPQLYDAMTAATREFQGLAKDVRTNPKKFLTLRLAIF
jgi:phospholipid/cholesterol/gamma-HCH transport system substrate-binding protein